MKLFLFPLIIGLPLCIKATSRHGIFDRLSNMKRQMSENNGRRLMSSENLHKSDCSLQYYNQTVYRRRCKPKTIRNTFCVGTCNSFHLPGERNAKISQSCSALQQRVTVVMLECPWRRQKYKSTRIVRATRCGCQACN